MAVDCSAVSQSAPRNRFGSSALVQIADRDCCFGRITHSTYAHLTTLAEIGQIDVTGGGE